MAIDNQSLPTVTDKRRASREAVPLISETTLLHQDHDFLEQPREPVSNRGKPVDQPREAHQLARGTARGPTEGIPSLNRGHPIDF
jgi:hypothetical protein